LNVLIFTYLTDEQECESPEYVSLDGHAIEARYLREKVAQYEQLLFEERTAHQETTKHGQKLLDDVFAAVQHAVNLSEETRAPMEIKLPSPFEILLELQLQRGRNEVLVKLIDSSIDIEEQSACAYGLQRYLEFAHRQVEAHLEWITTKADDGMNPVEGDSGASHGGE